jgi:DNA invertase Pin-like site-specific DNA recombinase
MKKAIIYTRVSTDEQANSGYSLQHQKVLLEQYCKMQNIEIVKHYQEDFSAKTFDRPEIKKAFEYIKNNKKDVDLFLFTKWDRFSRNQEEAIKAIRQLDNSGIKVNCVEQPLDLENPDNKILLSMYLIIPEVENDKNSQRTKDGMRRAMKEGCFMGKAPVGYAHSRDENENSTLKPDGEEA